MRRGPAPTTLLHDPRGVPVRLLPTRRCAHDPCPSIPRRAPARHPAPARPLRLRGADRRARLPARLGPPHGDRSRPGDRGLAGRRQLEHRVVREHRERPHRREAAAPQRAGRDQRRGRRRLGAGGGGDAGALGLAEGAAPGVRGGAGQRRQRDRRGGVLQRHRAEGGGAVQDLGGLAGEREGDPDRQRLRLRRAAAAGGEAARHGERGQRGPGRHRAAHEGVQRHAELAAPAERRQRAQELPGRDVPHAEGDGDRRLERRPGHLHHRRAALALRGAQRRQRPLPLPHPGAHRRGRRLDGQLHRHDRPPARHQRAVGRLRGRLGGGVPRRPVRRQLRHHHHRPPPGAQPLHHPRRDHRAGGDRHLAQAGSRGWAGARTTSPGPRRTSPT